MILQSNHFDTSNDIFIINGNNGSGTKLCMGLPECFLVVRCGVYVPTGQGRRLLPEKLKYFWSIFVPDDQDSSKQFSVRYVLQQTMSVIGVFSFP